MRLSLRLVAAVIVLFCSNDVLHASTASDTLQRQPRERFRRGVDTALALLGMRLADLSMPPDLLDRDPHRTLFHDSLFVDPLRATDWTDEVATALISRENLALRAAFSSLGKTVWPAKEYPPMMPQKYRAYADTIQRQLRRVSPATKKLFDRFIESTSMAASMTEMLRLVIRDQQNAKDSRWFVRQLDSIWTPSMEDARLTLWQVYDNEQHGTEVTSAISTSIETLPSTERVCSIGMELYLDCLAQMQAVMSNNPSRKDSVRSVVINTPAGRFAIGGTGNDSYSGAYALIIDVGGNDTYDLVESDSTMTQIIIDMDGDDIYRGQDHTLGSGHFGIGILIDRAGDDQYTARDFALGSGTYGIGILHDMAGNDVYRSRSNSQGAGIVGMGLLLDDTGHDLYVCASQSQAFGATRGVGILSDNAGNDRYIAVSPFADVLRYDDHQVSFAQGAALGSRPIMSGGVGLLIDASGNDLYSCDIYGQGTGYWFGLGALIDRAGDDRYDAYQYAQGSGVHFAVGLLNDLSGEDVYRSHGVSQGCGHDIATGILRDHAGNDTYMCESLSLGAGNANAVSILFDERGDDSYSAMNDGNTVGYSDMRRGYGMLGLFIDAAGRDRYGDTQQNDTTMVRSTYGILLDADLNPSSTTSSASTSSSAQSSGLSSRVDSLFIQASASHLRFQNNVAPARKELGRRGNESLSFLETRMSTQMPRERLTLENVLPDLYATHRDSTTALLDRSLSSADNATMSMAATVIGKVKAKEFIPKLTGMLSDTLWRRRRTAAATIGEIGDSASALVLKGACSDQHPYVRQRAAYHSARMLSPDTVLLRPLLDDTLQIVRMAAVEGIVRGTKRPMASILPLIDGHSDHRSLPSVMRLLAASDTTASDVETFTRWWSQQDASGKGLVRRIGAALPSPLTKVMEGKQNLQPTEPKK
ncbi:MAG: hypothetical protein FGM32_03015 [Candidatus Kapabacteria bacterium]|nr:hypothetical protein [Candidatus Kapabacteria bacterium]